MSQDAVLDAEQTGKSSPSDSADSERLDADEGLAYAAKLITRLSLIATYLRSDAEEVDAAIGLPAIDQLKLTVAALSDEACEIFGGRYLARFEPSRSSAVFIVESQFALWKLFSEYSVLVDWTPVKHEL